MQLIDEDIIIELIEKIQPEIITLIQEDQELPKTLKYLETKKHNIIHDTTSENIIKELKKISNELIILNSDPNWYTVHSQLQVIEKQYKHPPIILILNTEWPYGYRDKYNNPEKIPSLYRQAYKKSGVLPETSQLIDTGYNNQSYHAVYEFNPKNGVQRAIKDYLKLTTKKYSKQTIKIIPGITVLIPKSSIKLINEINDLIKDIDIEDQLEDQLENINENNQKIITLKQEITTLKQEISTIKEETSQKIIQEKIEYLENNDLFDNNWYLENNPELKDNISPIQSFLEGNNKSDPTPTFSLEKYRKNNKNIPINQNTYMYYLKEGIKNRDITFPSTQYNESFTPRIYSQKQIKNILKALNTKISIIIPVYNALSQTKECVESVLKYTKVPYEIIIINDNSPDEEVKPYLDTLEKQYTQIKVIHNKVNHGFVKNVNIGIKNTENDIILLNSDTKVTPKWIQKLIISAYTSSLIGTVTPLSNAAGAYSVPYIGKNNPIPSIGLNNMALLVEKISLKINIEVPTGNGFCLYIKRDTINDTGLFDAKTFEKGYGEENDFCMRATKHSWTHVIDETTYIYHEGGGSFNKKKKELEIAHKKILDQLYPDYDRLIQKFITHPTYTMIRQNIQKNLKKQENTPAHLYNLLYIIHEGIGGSLHFTNDLIKEVSKHYNCYILLSDSNKITLKKYEKDHFEQIYQWKLENKWNIEKFHDKQYETIYFNVIQGLNIDLIHVQHLIKHSYDIVNIANILKIPIVLSIHDFYYICPSFNLLDENNKYCNGKCNNNNKQCTIPIGAMQNVPILKEYNIKWQQENQKLLEMVNTIICPSNNTKELYLEKYPEIENKIRTIPHGQEFAKKEEINTKLEKNNIKILIPGNIGISKGSYFIKELKKQDTKNILELHFIGEVHESIHDKKYGIIHGAFKRDDFNKLVKEINPSFIGIFSIWPETFCYTLSEAWNAQIPVITVKLGAIGDRVNENITGYFIDYTNPKKAYNQILEIAKDPSCYNKIKENIKNIKLKTLKEMDEEYLELYNQLLK